MNIKELLTIIGVIILIFICGIYLNYRLFGLSTIEMIVVFIIICYLVNRL